jgi:hypothetical protein
VATEWWSSLDRDMDLLGRELPDEIPAAERDRYRALIQDKDLFREGTRVPETIRLRYYRMLLRLAFGIPLSYEDYCALEDWAGGSPLEQNLVAALATVRSDGRAVTLIHHAYTGRDRKQLSPATVVWAAAHRDLRPEHALLLCDIAVGYLTDKRSALDPAEIRQALAKYGYLAGALQRLYPYETQHQHEQLCRLLEAAYGRELSQRSAAEILEQPGFRPTDALFAAVLDMTAGTTEAAAVARYFARGRLSAAKLGGRRLRRLPAPSLPAEPADADARTQTDVDVDAHRGKRRTPRLRRQSKEQ